MKRKFTSLAALFLLGVTLLCACGAPAETATATKTAETKAETATVTEPVSSTEPLKDPADDDTLQILLVGNSFCYYWTDELYYLLKAAGIKASVSNVYYSGCTLKQHWEWYNSKETNYALYTYNEKGYQNIKNVSLKTCLAYRNWDVISLQQHFSINTAQSYEYALSSCTPYAEKLFGYLHEARPLAKLYWNETWAYQIGYDRNGYKMENKEGQTLQYEVIRDVSHTLVQKCGFDEFVPLGDAWQIARANKVIGDTLCNRTKEGADNTDYYHDGNVGGGQYLNACVFFEIVTGQSCVGNTYRPTGYSLSEAKIKALQEAAHKAAEALKA